MAAACDGLPMRSAAPYAGKVHPLVLINAWWGRYVDSAYAINKNWENGKWTDETIQLVVCVPFDQDASVDVGSCGRWRRSDGVVGELVKSRYALKIRVVVAATGKILQSKVIYGSVPPCGDAPEDQWSILNMNEDPPWHLLGIQVTDAQVNKYATAVSRQAVK